MKKTLLTILFILAFTNFVFCSSSYNSNNEIHIYINNNEQTNLSTQPIIIDNCILVSVNDIFSELGANVEWKENTKQIYITQNLVHIILSIDSNIAYVNEKPVYLDTQAKIINNHAMIPLRFFVTALSYQIIWNDSTRTVYIQTTINEQTANTESIKVGSIISFGNYFTKKITNITPEIISADYFSDNIEWGAEQFIDYTQINSSYIMRLCNRFGYTYYTTAPLNWYVINIKDDIATIILIDDISYNFNFIPCTEESGIITLKDSAKDWNNSIIRSFLNGLSNNYANYINYNFYNMAFSDEEKKSIIANNSTNDNLFLLSTSNINKYSLDILQNNYQYILKDTTNEKIFTINSNGTIKTYSPNDMLNIKFLPVLYLDINCD